MGASYYDGPDLTERVLDALRASGRDVDQLDSDDLAALDEFHALGRAATLALATLAGIRAGERVLDAGAGIGGPARALARHRGARVIALDPTERFCALNRELTARTGLAGDVEVVQGDARALPFEDASFDVVLSLNVWQSVADKPTLAREAFRVLRPGGRLALLDVLAGPGGELVFPVPWADGPEDSHILSEDGMRALLQTAGFAIGTFKTNPEIFEDIGRAQAAPGMAAGADGLSLDLLMPDYADRMAGIGRNIAEERIRLLALVATRP